MAQNPPQHDIASEEEEEEEKISILSLPNEILLQIAEYTTKPRIGHRTGEPFSEFFARCQAYKEKSRSKSWPGESGLKSLIPLSLTNRLFANITSEIFHKAACLAKNSTQAIYFAAANGNEKMVRLLLAKGEGIKFQFKPGPGAKVRYLNSPGIYDETIIRHVMEKGPNFEHGGYSSLEWAITSGKKALMRRALERGANVRARCARAHNAGLFTVGEWALHVAAEERLGEPISIELLLGMGVNVNAQKSTDGATALHRAAFVGCPSTIRQLIKGGADVNIMDNDGRTSLDYAKRPRGIPRPPGRELKDLVWPLLEAGAIDEKPGTSLLHMAVEYDHLRLVKYLLRHGFDIDARDDNDDTPFHLAVKTGNIDIVKVLLAKGADINACALCGWTGLHFAVRLGYKTGYEQKRMIELLVEYGSDINARDGHGKTPLMFAGRNFDDRTLALLSGELDINASAGSTDMRKKSRD